MLIKHFKYSILWLLIVSLVCLYKIDALSSSERLFLQLIEKIWGLISNKPYPYRSFFLNHMDKVAHVFFFFVLSVLFSISLARQHTYPLARKYPISVSGIFCIGYGALIEGLQAIIFTYRTGDIYDFLADIIGVGLAIIPSYIYINRITKTSCY